MASVVVGSCPLYTMVQYLEGGRFSSSHRMSTIMQISLPEEARRVTRRPGKMTVLKEAMNHIFDGVLDVDNNIQNMRV